MRPAIHSLPLLLLALALPLCAQTNYPPPVQFTADQDHSNMMAQLGIEALRPGPSGDEHAPNHANYDEALANPYPNLPPVLVLDNGKRVTTARQWWQQRRPQIVEAMSREVYGFIPPNVPKVTWRVTAVSPETIAGVAMVVRRVTGHVDNSAYPLIDVNLSLLVVLPAAAKTPVPVLMMFRSATPTVPYLALNANPNATPGFEVSPASDTRGAELLNAGWGYALLDPASIQADNAEGLTRGIIGLVNHGQPRKPDQWGALRAWSWGAARALDYLESDPAVAARHVGIEGVSRYGKAALVTLAFEQRFAMGLIGSSGEGGAKLNRRNFGEAVESLTGGEYYWMAGNFLKYGASDATFGSKTANDLPVDSHELIALCAPRLTFISYGIPEQGDANWLDQKGSYMAAVAAQPVFTLLGARAMGVPPDPKTASMPPVNQGLLDGQLAWRQHDGGHTDAPNFKYFIAWADRNIDYQPINQPH